MEGAIAIAVTLMIAIWSACGFLAIKYPETYRTFGIPVAFVASLLAFAFFGYAAGIMAGVSAVGEFLKGDSIAQGYDTGKAASVGPFVIAILITGFTLGLFAIGLVGQHIESQREENDEADDENAKPK